MRRYRFVIALLALTGSAAFALSAELEIPPRPAPDNVSVHKWPPNCSRWTDGCVSCSRDDKDEQPVCSNTGIACQPRAVVCLNPAAPEKK